MSDVSEEKLKVGPAQKVAGGLTAVASSLKHSLKEMGVVRSLQTLTHVNQGRGFDCPGCAWPDPDDRRSIVEFCENGAKAVAEEATRRTIGADFFQRHRISDLLTLTDYELGKQGRLTVPLYRPQGSDHYQEISWDEAFTLIARHLNQLLSTDKSSSPNQAVFYTSGRTSNEAAYLYQLFVRLLGTNNLPDCSNMCHESSGVALNRVMGSGKGSVTLADFCKAQAIFVIGQNPGTNHPRMLTALQEAKRHGCKIVSINPLPEAGLIRFKHPQEVSGILGSGTSLSDLFLQVKINGDIPLLKGMMKYLLEFEKIENVLDREFINNFTTGFSEFKTELETISWEEITSLSGIAKEQIIEAAEIYSNSQATICCWAMGITQHKNAVANIQEIMNLLYLKGNIGKPGAGACPVRGHSNVQGDRTMGICERPNPAFLKSLGSEFDFAPPTEHGYDVVAAIKAMDAEKVKVFLCMGGNFLSASPDSEFTAQALKKCQLTVQISTKLNRSHLVTGREALILPCLGRTEIDQGQRVTVENSMGVVHPSQGNLNPCSPHLKSEVAIVAHMAMALVPTLPCMGKVPWQYFMNNYDLIRDSIARVIPGFTDFNHQLQLHPKGFHLPHAARDHRQFLTPSTKAHFTVNLLPQWRLLANEFLMMTIRSHDQYNTTIYGLHDRYRGIYYGRRVILMNKKDIAKNNWREGDVVNIVSHFQGQQRMAPQFKIIAYDIPEQCLASYFPETNVLVAIDDKADFSHTPASKSIVVTLQASVGPQQSTPDRGPQV